MDLFSIIIIFVLCMIILIFLLFPMMIGIPMYKLTLIKLRKSMIILMLNPSKRLELKEATSKTSMIETKNGHYHFLNIPDAVYSLFGIPTAIAYHKYGAILPMQNIVHATHMKELGFQTIGDVKAALNQLQTMINGDETHVGLLQKQTNTAKTVKSLENELNSFLFDINENTLDKLLTSNHFPRDLRKQFKESNYQLTSKPEIKQIDDATWTLTSESDLFTIVKENDEDVI